MTESRSRIAPRAGWRPVMFAILLAAFVFRVGAQLVQAMAPSGGLPAFDQVQAAAALPYPLLLAGQAIIIAAALWATWAMWNGKPEPQPRLGRMMVWVGWIYLVGAAFRFFAGLTFLSNVGFFDTHLPGFFHIVLAAMVLLFAAHLADEARGQAGG